MFPWWIWMPIAISVGMIVYMTCKWIKYPAWIAIVIAGTTTMVVGRYLY